jgi:hypothetical protein
MPAPVPEPQVEDLFEAQVRKCVESDPDVQMARKHLAMMEADSIDADASEMNLGRAADNAAFDAKKALEALLAAVNAVAAAAPKDIPAAQQEVAKCAKALSDAEQKAQKATQAHLASFFAKTMAASAVDEAKRALKSTLESARAKCRTKILENMRTGG